MLCSASSCCWRRTKTSLSSGSRCQEWNSNCFSSKNFYQRNWSQPFALLYSHWIWIVIDRTWLVPTPSSLLTATSASPTGKCFSQQSLCCLNPGHLYHQIFILISGVTSSSKSLICQTDPGQDPVPLDIWYWHMSSVQSWFWHMPIAQYISMSYLSVPIRAV